MNNQQLKIFACDHRTLKDKKWQYPFQRIGTGFNNDCILKDIDGISICTERNNKFFSEYTTIWWLWKHLKELDISKYIGFIHYRRFFTIAAPNYGVFPINIQAKDLDEDIIKKVIPNEGQLLQILENNNLNGILPCRFPDYSYVGKCKNITDLMFEESKMLQLGFDECSCKMMFDVLFKHMSQFFDKKILEIIEYELNTYHFNMFIIDLGHFEIYSQIMEKTILEVTENLDQQKNLVLHSRALSYSIERFSSCIFLAMIKCGARFGELPIMMIDNKETLA